MTISINVAGVWKDVDTPKHNVAGVWKTPDKVSINVVGVWKDVWPTGPSVSATADGCSNFRSSGTVYGGPRFLNTGAEQEYTNTGGVTSKGNWLDSGASSEVWVEWTRTGGSLANWDVWPGAGRHQLSTTRSYQINRSSAGVESIAGYFRFYDAASGGNLLQQTSTVTWSIEQGIL